MIIFILSYVLFGYFLLRFLNIEKHLDAMERVVISPILGISFVASCIALAGEVFSTSAYFILFLTAALGISAAKFFYRDIHLILQSLKHRKQSVFLGLLLIGIFSSTLIFSHYKSGGSLQLQELHDSIWHVALIENLQDAIPPVHPSTSQISLNNYHYFYDLFLASIIRYSILTPFVAYFQLSVLLLSLLLICSTYILGRRIHSRLAGILLSLFTVITGSFAYLIPIFNPGQIWHESSFWVSQTLVMIVNPQIIYTLAVSSVVFLFLYILNRENLSKSEQFAVHILLIILISTSIGFKSYAWVILSVVYAAYLLLELLRKKSYKSILMGLLYVFISLPFMWMITGFETGSFFYEPLWYTNTMIESPDRVNYLEWKFLQDHYVATNNWIRLTILETQKILIFYLGNLSIRSLFFILPVLLLMNGKAKNKYAIFTVLLFVGFLFSTIFPLLFLQKGTVWNSIQFFYYGLLFANIGLVLALVIGVKKFKLDKYFPIIIVLLVLLSLPTSVKTVRDKVVDPFILSGDETSFLSELHESDSISICPDGSDFYKTSLVKAISPAQVYLANPSQIALVGSDTSIQDEYEELYRQKNVADLKRFYSENDINYIICTDESQSKDLGERLMTDVTQKGKLFILELSE